MNFLSFRFLFKRIRAIKEMMKDKTVPKRKKALVIFGLIYLFLPVDIIPPVLFPFGFLDDLVLWLFIIWHLSDILDTYWMGEKTEDYSGKFKSKNLVEDVTFDVDEDGDGKSEYSNRPENENEEIYDITEQMEFTGDRQGSYNTPFALHVSGEATEIADLNAQLKVYPVVARDVVTVNLPSARIDRLALYNTGGVAVISMANLEAPAQINVSSLSEGVYIVVVTSQGNTYYQKIVKRN